MNNNFNGDIFSLAQQDSVIEESVMLTLNNFGLAWHISDLLIEYSAASLPPPQATVCLNGAGRSVVIPGQNCGFFVTPVIQIAILEIRKSLGFFGLCLSSETHSIVPLKKRQKNDIGIEHFGLPWATVDLLIGGSAFMKTAQLENMLSDVYQWCNKRLAHFTLSQPDIKLEYIRDVSMVMIDVYFRLLFDALGRPRPQIQPINSQIA